MINQILTALHCDNVPKVPHGYEITRLGAPAIVGAHAGSEDREMDSLDAERDSRFGVCRAERCGVLIPENHIGVLCEFNECDKCSIPF